MKRYYVTKGAVEGWVVNDRRQNDQIHYGVLPRWNARLVCWMANKFLSETSVEKMKRGAPDQ